MLENVSLFIFSKGRQSVAEQMKSINISKFFFLINGEKTFDICCNYWAKLELVFVAQNCQISLSS